MGKENSEDAIHNFIIGQFGKLFLWKNDLLTVETNLFTGFISSEQM